MQGGTTRSKGPGTAGLFLFTVSTCVSLSLSTFGREVPEQGWNVEVLSQVSLFARRVAVVGDYACLCEGRSLSILDVSNPASPTPVGRFLFQDDVWDVSVSGGLAYVVDRQGGLHAIDISDPARASLRSIYPIADAWAVGAVEASDALVFVGDRMLRIIDVSDPSSPARIGRSDGPFGSRLLVSDNLAYIYGGAGFDVVNVSDPSSPTRTGRLRMPYDTQPPWIGSLQNLSVYNGIAHIAGSERGLWAVRYTGPRPPATAVLPPWRLYE